MIDNDEFEAAIAASMMSYDVERATRKTRDVTFAIDPKDYLDRNSILEIVRQTDCGVEGDIAVDVKSKTMTFKLFSSDETADLVGIEALLRGLLEVVTPAPRAPAPAPRAPATAAARPVPVPQRLPSPPSVPLVPKAAAAQSALPAAAAAATAGTATAGTAAAATAGSAAAAADDFDFDFEEEYGLYFGGGVQPARREMSNTVERTAIIDLLKLEEEIDGFEQDILHSLTNRFGVGADWLCNRTLELRSESGEVLEETVKFFNELLEDPKSKLRELLPIHKRQINITSQASLIIGRQGVIVKYLQREMCCRIKTIKASGQTHLIAESVNVAALDATEGRIQSILADPESFREEIQRRQNKKVHVFVDASNIMFSSQLVNGVRDFSVRLKVDKLVEIVLSLRTLSHGVVVGATPAESSPMWKLWRDLEFETHVLRLVTDGARRVEEAVDDTLQASIQRDLGKDYGGEPRTLVLMTGDGNQNHGRVTFPDIIEQALRFGWNVELWSWSETMNSVYTAFSANYPSLFSIHALDPHRSLITYRVKPNERVHAGPFVRGPPVPPAAYSLETKKPQPKKDYKGKGEKLPYHAPNPPAKSIADGAVVSGKQSKPVFHLGDTSQLSPVRSPPQAATAGATALPLAPTLQVPETGPHRERSSDAASNAAANAALERQIREVKLHYDEQLRLEREKQALLQQQLLEQENRRLEALQLLQQQDEHKSKEKAKAEIKLNSEFEDLLSCPLSFEIMQDPVSCKCGHTFERVHIVAWLAKEQTCPMSKDPLQVQDLIENRSLRDVIEKMARSRK